MSRTRQFDNILASLERDTPAVSMMRRNAEIIRQQEAEQQHEAREYPLNQCTGGMK